MGSPFSFYVLQNANPFRSLKRFFAYKRGVILPIGHVLLLLANTHFETIYLFFMLARGNLSDEQRTQQEAGNSGTFTLRFVRLIMDSIVCASFLRTKKVLQCRGLLCSRWEPRRLQSTHPS